MSDHIDPNRTVRNFRPDVPDSAFDGIIRATGSTALAIDLARWKERAEKAEAALSSLDAGELDLADFDGITPGEWMAETTGADAKVRCSDGRTFTVGDIVYHPENKINARAIAAVPAMIAEIRALRAKLSETRQALTRAHFTPEQIERIIDNITKEVEARKEADRG